MNLSFMSFLYAALEIMPKESEDVVDRIFSEQSAGWWKLRDKLFETGSK